MIQRIYQSSAQRFRQALQPVRGRVRKIPLLGKMARYVKRLVFLPWNFAKYLERFEQFERSIGHEVRHLHNTVYQLAHGTALDVISEIRQLSHNQSKMREEILQIKFRCADFYGALVKDVSAQEKVLSTMAKTVSAIGTGLDQNGRQLETVSDRVAGAHDGIAEIVSLALELRERVARGSENNRLPEPRIVNLENYRKRLDTMDGDVQVNLGCGEKPLAPYINVDFRELPEVDIIADVHKLPFKDASVGEIRSDHLIEHFREHHLRTVLLPYWKRLLRPGGRLRIVCPNWDAMLNLHHAGKISLAELKHFTFGPQDYSGDDHLAMYSPETLANLLRDSGFQSVTAVAEDRDNGGCRDMEIVAVAA